MNFRGSSPVELRDDGIQPCPTRCAPNPAAYTANGPATRPALGQHRSTTDSPYTISSSHQSEVPRSNPGKTREIMQTSTATITPTCEKFQPEIGMPAEWAKKGVMPTAA
jgi:hypothetical protein